MLRHFFSGFGRHSIERAGLDLVGLGQDDAVADRCLVEHFHHLAVDIFQPVAAIDQHQRAVQHLPPAQIGFYQRLPFLDNLHRRFGKAVSGHVDQTEQRGVAHFKDVEFLRPPRGHRCASDCLAPGDRVEQRAFADIGTPAKGDFRHCRFGQEFQLRCRQQEIDPARKQLGRAPGQFGPVLGFLRFQFLGAQCAAHGLLFASRADAAALSALSFSAAARSCGCLE